MHSAHKENGEVVSTTSMLDTQYNILDVVYTEATGTTSCVCGIVSLCLPEITQACTCVIVETKYERWGEVRCNVHTHCSPFTVVFTSVVLR